MRIKLYIAASILIAFHAIGFILFQHDAENAELTWLNILLTSFLLLLFENHQLNHVLTMIFIVIGGFVIELIGINSSLLFGEYSYGEALGVKFANTPPVIGLNWLCIIIAAVNLSNILPINNLYLKALISGAFAVGLDYVIEPVAIKYNMWTWEDNSIPISNYITWFFFAVLFAFLYLRSHKERNPLGVILYLLWFFFFIALNFQI